MRCKGSCQTLRREQINKPVGEGVPLSWSWPGGGGGGWRGRGYLCPGPDWGGAERGYPCSDPDRGRGVRVPLSWSWLAGWGGGTPVLVPSGGWGSGGGYPSEDQHMGTPSPGHNMPWTGYAAGGTPLAVNRRTFFLNKAFKCNSSNSLFGTSQCQRTNRGIR